VVLETLDGGDPCHPNLEARKKDRTRSIVARNFVLCHRHQASNAMAESGGTNMAVLPAHNYQACVGN
jgi:hypothetical protein